MGSALSLPRTPIEWFMLAPALIVINVVVLVATGHPLPIAFAMGLFYGILIAFVVLFAALVWNTFRGGDRGETDPDSLE